MKRYHGLSMLMLLFGLAACVLEAPYEPVLDVEVKDLVGTWCRRSHRGIETLIIREDMTFRQIYLERSGYVYDTPWSHWEIERLPQGGTRVHLYGARWFYMGGGYAERHNLDSMFDLFVDEFVDTKGQLVLVVRRFRSGEMILHHLWDAGGDTAAFPLIGGSEMYFRKVGPPQ